MPIATEDDHKPMGNLSGCTRYSNRFDSMSEEMLANRMTPT